MHALRIGAIAVATAAAVLVGAGGDAFWLCMPAALLAAGPCRTRAGAAIATAAIVASAAAPVLLLRGLTPLPPPLLVVIVPAASLIALRTIQERLERERDAMRSSAHTDPLTGAANRRSLTERIQYEVARHTRSGRSFTLAMLDVDGFKLLNDRFGHAAGDELLCDLARALQRSVRAQDTVARIGGDEFCVLAPETDEAGVQPLLARISEAVGAVRAGVHRLEARAGAAVFPIDGTSATELLHAADLRLLRAKRAVRHARAQRRAA
jgi:diguanylate cyclase (GGDEF)-like protein